MKRNCGIAALALYPRHANKPSGMKQTDWATVQNQQQKKIFGHDCVPS